MSAARRHGTLPLAALLLAGAAATGAAPSDGAVDAQAPVTQQSILENKTRLVGVLLTQSPAVQRIPSSGNAQAQKQLADARALYDQAAREAQGGQIGAAVRMLDQALLGIVSAARLVPDPARELAQERSRYGTLTEATRVYINLYENLLSRMNDRKVQAAPGAPDSKQIRAQLTDAAAFAAGSQYAKANGVLQGAYDSVVAALSRTLMAETIVYDQTFDSPEAEYRHELARNRSYEDLVPLALAQLNPAPETARMSQRYAQQGRALRESAQKQAASGDYPAALKILHEATATLQRSLRVAGVVVPTLPDR